MIWSFWVFNLKVSFFNKVVRSNFSSVTLQIMELLQSTTECPVAEIWLIILGTKYCPPLTAEVASTQAVLDCVQVAHFKVETQVFNRPQKDFGKDLKIQWANVIEKDQRHQWLLEWKTKILTPKATELILSKTETESSEDKYSL